MSKRRLSLPLTDLKQMGITQFVERELKKEQPIKFIGARRSSQPSASSVQTPVAGPSTESAKKKRTRPEVASPDSSTERQPNKKQAINMGDNEQVVNITVEDHGNLRPELIELKRQLFAGFEQLIEPIKKDIKALKSERNLEAKTLHVETVN